MEQELVKIFGSYHAWKTTEDTWIISAMGGTQNAYLLEGEEKALLIDTFWGAGNLRAYVETLTEKPILVINTHGHLDHSGGNGEWEQVMLPEGAVPDLKTCDNGPFDVSKLPHPYYEKVIVRDGDRIDLGGRVLDIIEITAHSNGSVALLDAQRQQLFVGDEVESAQVLMFDAVAQSIFGRPPFVLEKRLVRHHANMRKLLQLRDCWAFVYPAHNGAPIAPDYVADYLELTQHIFAGDAIIEENLNHEHIEQGDPAHTLCRVRWKKASFFVKKDELRAIWGSPKL